MSTNVSSVWRVQNSGEEEEGEGEKEGLALCCLLTSYIYFHPQILLLCDTLQNYPLHPVISIFIVLTHPKHLTLAQVKFHLPIFCPIYASINTFLNVITTPSAIHLTSKICVICTFGKLTLHPTFQIIDVNNEE